MPEKRLRHTNRTALCLHEPKHTQPMDQGTVTFDAKKLHHVLNSNWNVDFLDTV